MVLRASPVPAEKEDVAAPAVWPAIDRALPITNEPAPQVMLPEHVTVLVPTLPS